MIIKGQKGQVKVNAMFTSEMLYNFVKLRNILFINSTAIELVKIFGGIFGTRAAKGTAR